MLWPVGHLDHVSPLRLCIGCNEIVPLLPFAFDNLEQCHSYISGCHKQAWQIIADHNNGHH
ncbi:hypothetical protein Leryth_003042 [Lithospermum erythrorhizon]|nr:hypothetical protein Leryth_003042 [Lithospermum erythrorhizon]